MDLYKVEFKRKVVKFLSKLDKKAKVRIVSKIEELENYPIPLGSKKLRGAENTYRVRSGEFRILYKILKDEKVVLVFRIDKRPRVYRRLFN
jgi:mRNA interferase RelE/StbE